MCNAIVTLRHKLIYLHATHLNTAAQRRARVIEQAFNCNIWNEAKVWHMCGAG